MELSRTFVHVEVLDVETDDLSTLAEVLRNSWRFVHVDGEEVDYDLHDVSATGDASTTIAPEDVCDTILHRISSALPNCEATVYVQSEDSPSHEKTHRPVEQ
jgi:hypothetical protein